MNFYRNRKAFTLVELLVVIAIIGILVGLLMPTLQSLRESSRRMTCSSRLAKVGLGLSAYQITNGFYPSGTTDTASQVRSLPSGSHHNWISAILPHMDMHALANVVDPSVSVYDQGNKKARQTAVAGFRCPSAPTEIPATASCFAGIHSPIETPIAADNNGVLILNRRLTESDISDGIGYTMFVGEVLSRAGEDLGWMSGTRSTLRNTGHKFLSGYSVDQPSPASQASEPDLFVGGLGSGHPSGAHILQGSGRIQFFSDTGDLRVLQQLAHRSDGGNEIFDNPAPDPLSTFTPPKKSTPAEAKPQEGDSAETTSSDAETNDAEPEGSAEADDAPAEEDATAEEDASQTASDADDPS